MKSDSELEQEVRKVVSTQTALNGNEIGVRVRAGVVTLTGRAPSALAKWNMADSIAGLPGIDSLIDEVLVLPDARIQTPDPDIARPWFPAR